jgi:hypothetical protein
MKYFVTTLFFLFIAAAIFAGEPKFEYREGHPDLKSDKNSRYEVYPFPSAEAETALQALLRQELHQPAMEIVRYYVTYIIEQCYQANRNSYLAKNVITNNIKLVIKHATSELVGVEIYCPYGIDGTGDSWVTLFTIQDKEIIDIDLYIKYALYYEGNDNFHYVTENDKHNPEMNETFLNHLSRLTALTTLNIQYGENNCDPLAKLTNLTRLILRTTHITPSLPTVIRSLQNLEKTEIIVTRSRANNNEEISQTLNTLYEVIQSHPKLRHVELSGNVFDNSLTINGYDKKNCNGSILLFKNDIDEYWFSVPNYGGWRGLYKESLRQRSYLVKEETFPLKRKHLDKLLKPETREAAWKMLNCVVDELIAEPCKRQNQNPAEMRAKILAGISIIVITNQDGTINVKLDSEYGLGMGDEESEYSCTDLFTIRNGVVVSFYLETHFSMGNLESNTLPLTISNTAFVKALSELSTIETLSLKFDQFEDEEALESLRTLKNLKDLQIRLPYIPKQLQYAVGGMASLETFDIAYTNSYPDSNKTRKSKDSERLDGLLIELRYCPKLKSITSLNIAPIEGWAFPQLRSVIQLKLPVTGDTALENIGQMSQLIDLTLLSTKELDSYPGYCYTNKSLESLESLTKLRFLSFDNPALSFTYFPVLPELETIILKNMIMVSSDLVQLSHCPNLRQLECEGTLVPRDEKEFVRFKKLRSLCLSLRDDWYNKTSSDMSMFPILPKLEYLMISKSFTNNKPSGITDDVLMLLLRSPNLNEVYLGGENVITIKGLTDAYLSYPNIRKSYVR